MDNLGPDGKTGQEAHRHPDPLPVCVSRQVHQSVSENLWFENMLGISVTKAPLPTEETRLAFLDLYARNASRRLAELRARPDDWWEADASFFEVTRSRAADAGGLMQNDAPVVCAYPGLSELLNGEKADGRKASLPGPGERPATERPGS